MTGFATDLNARQNKLGSNSLGIINSMDVNGQTSIEINALYKPTTSGTR